MTVRKQQPRAIVWRNTLLSGSETFIRYQMDSLPTWQSSAVGLRERRSDLSRDGDTIIFDNSITNRLRRRSFERTRSDPRVTRRIADLHADLIHAHFGPDAVAISPTAARLGIPLVMTLHGYDVTSHAKQDTRAGGRYRLQLKNAFESASVIIAVSDYIRTCALDLGAPHDKLVRHHTGIPIPEPAAGTESRWDVLFVGRLVEKKGVDDLLRAVQSLPSGAPRPRIGIAGDGELRSALEDTATALGVEVTFLGGLSPEQVKDAMRASRVLAVPSKTSRSGDSEGLPTVVMEAAALGVPIAGYDHSGIGEAVRHGVTGLLAEEGDVEGLARNLQILLSDEDKRRRLGEAGRDFMLEKFDIRTQAIRLEAIYDRAGRP